MMIDKRTPWIFFVLSLIVSQNLLGDKVPPRTILFVYPLTAGSPISLMYNVKEKFSLGFDYTGEDARDRLSPKEKQKNPNMALVSASQEIGGSICRYTTPENMSGLYLGLGGGYKKTAVLWKTQPQEADGTRKAFLMAASGPTAYLRGGYRFVAPDIGFSASLFVIGKYYDLALRDLTQVQSQTFTYVASTEDDKKTLTQKLRTEVMPGLEIGWAF